MKFMKSLSLLSVPVPGGEAFGAYMIESLAAGVPIVQPNAGGYPEFVANTGGGIIYEPNDPEHLAKALAGLLAEPNRLRQLGETGKKAVLEKYFENQWIFPKRAHLPHHSKALLELLSEYL